jgi:hypothetical protein
MCPHGLCADAELWSDVFVGLAIAALIIGFRALKLPVQEGQKLLRGTCAHKHTSPPARIQDEGRIASDAYLLPVVQVAQHALEGLPAL